MTLTNMTRWVPDELKRREWLYPDPLSTEWVGRRGLVVDPVPQRFVVQAWNVVPAPREEVVGFPWVSH
jgi:hypothetical protein